MSFSLLARKLVCGLAVVIPFIVSAESGFAPLGGEYAIAGALPGDQVMPHVSINAGGGYIVWQDNATDGDGWGISGRALNGSLNGAGGPFRVNGTSKADQENARVALLNNGGAVFVWQGGRQGFQHIYARFLSTSNTWLGLDQMVNASAKIYQGNPAVTVLNNGNAVIVYASFNTNTMQDVYGQIFSPTGQKLGAEFQINEFTPFNQRTPSVTALADGGFVVAWVSEQKRNLGGTNSVAVSPSQFQLASVDIYARRFDANGLATMSEFLVNDSANASANPAVAAAVDGSVLFSWSGKDSKLLNNGWDVYVRPFTFPSSISYIAGMERRVNTQLYGDQFAPRVSASGTNYLVIWTSIGQDGSGAGIYGQFLNLDGTSVGDELRVNSTTLGSQQEPALAADGAGRFLAVWTSPSYSASRNDLFAEIFAGGDFISPPPTAIYAAPSYVGEAPAKIDTSSSKIIPGPYIEPPTLGYPGAVSSGGSGVPATNAFGLAAGNYNGLFYEAAGVSPASSGYFRAKTTSGKGYSASLTMGGTSYSLSGSFDDLGNSGTRIIPRGTFTPLVVNFREDLAGGDQIHGEVKSGNWTAMLLADRQVFNQTTQKTPLAGKYTLAFAAAANVPSGPAGSGFGTAAVDDAGSVSWSVTLADGTKPSASKSPNAISKSGIWPVYATFSDGLVMGWIQIKSVAPTPNGAVTGDLICFKAASASAASYKAGYTNEVSVIGAPYVRPVSGAGQLHLSGAGLGSTLESSVIFSGSSAPARGANLKTFNLKTDGSFAGSLTSPSIPFYGVLLEGGTGAGFFINTNKQSGPVNLNQP